MTKSVVKIEAHLIHGTTYTLERNSPDETLNAKIIDGVVELSRRKRGLDPGFGYGAEVYTQMEAVIPLSSLKLLEYTNE